MSALNCSNSNRQPTEAELWVAVTRLVGEFGAFFKKTTFPELRNLRVLKGPGLNNVWLLFPESDFKDATATSMPGLDILKIQGVFGETGRAKLQDENVETLELWGLTRQSKWILIECQLRNERYGSNALEWCQTLIAITSRPSTLDEILDNVPAELIIKALYDQIERLHKLAEESMSAIEVLQNICASTIANIPRDAGTICEVSIQRDEANINFLAAKAARIDRCPSDNQQLLVQIIVPKGFGYCPRCGLVSCFPTCDDCKVKIVKPITE